MFLYHGSGRNLILRYKHANRLEATASYAQWLYQTGKDLVETCDVIIPVPLHWTRRLLRGYNQAAELAKSLALCAHKPLSLDALVRKRRTAQQYPSLTQDSAKARKQRFLNVKNAFKVKAKRQQNIIGKHILLIDDVITSGATAHACSQTLKQAGAQHVDVLALALVGKPLT